MKTNWDNYYQAPIATASYSRKITENRLLKSFLEYSTNEIAHICELGGANSCFFSSIRKQHPKAKYTIVDNNKVGIELFKKTHPNDLKVELLTHDVLAGPKLEIGADLVFSVGLIEHFTKEDTAKVIKAHFECVKPGQLVIMTFPTPTWLYKATRRLSEALGLWIFHDERPVPLSEVSEEVSKHAEILHLSINWAVILTQGVIVARKKT